MPKVFGGNQFCALGEDLPFETLDEVKPEIQFRKRK